MAAKFKCPSCHKVLAVAGDGAGAMTKCPSCGQFMRIPRQPMDLSEADTALRIGDPHPPAVPVRPPPPPPPKATRRAAALRKPRPEARVSASAIVLPALVLVALIGVGGFVLWPRLKARRASEQAKAPDAAKPATKAPAPKTSAKAAEEPEPPLNPLPPKPLPPLDLPVGAALRIGGAEATVSADGRIHLALQCSSPTKADAAAESVKVLFLTRQANLKAPEGDASGPLELAAVLRKAAKERAALDLLSEWVAKNGQGKVAGGIVTFAIEGDAGAKAVKATGFLKARGVDPVSPADVYPRYLAVVLYGQRPSAEGFGPLSNVVWVPLPAK